MKLANLSDAQIAKLKAIRVDEFVEKHEGPFDWASYLKYDKPEFVEIAGHWVLLPMDEERHANLRILRCVVSNDDRMLTIFLRDLTYEADEDSRYNGYVAICERLDETEGYVTVFYHAWFVI